MGNMRRKRRAKQQRQLLLALFIKMELDGWQQEVVEYEGNLVLRSGRQVGKSTAVGEKAARFALKYDNTIQLIIAASQRQAWHLFQKVTESLDFENRKAIEASGGYTWRQDISERRNYELKREFELLHGIYKETPTKSELCLKNGSKVFSLPAGKTGVFIRCFTIDQLLADEAPYIPEVVWTAVRPMLAVSHKTRGMGWIVLLGTPFGKGGYFYDCCFDPEFKQFHVSSEECSRISKEFLLKEKKRMTRLEYSQEYLGEFVDEFHQFFPTALVKKRMTFMTWNFKEEYKAQLKYILRLEDMYNFNRILIDDAGIGAGLNDMLIEKLGRKVVGLGNAKKTIDKEGNKSKIFKEDLYSHAAAMLEQDGKLEIINDLKLLKSLKCMTFNYTAEKNIRIFGKYSHLSEAFVRVCWAEKAKSLKLFVY